ncbi:MAG: Na(+)-translocating NADH-quinone reductase subunit A [Bacteroidales bacterium]|nr:Na(+)-translocating NADH-quinone reductase subunit A [Bacteroidales bacterium]MDZ4203576.1 Na(+)-translocating NADH-quinone reductase subunit A [Bacteroidales bacterium]
MTKVVRITKGLDIPLKGEAEKIIKELPITQVAIKPTDFIGVFPKLLVKEGDPVQVGSPVFFNKYREEILFTSPVSGHITEIRRGDKRVLLEVRIEADGNQTTIDFDAADPNELSRNDIVKKMIDSGVWPLLRQRPYSVIANPSEIPKAIHIPAFDTSPLAPDYDFIVHGKGDFFQTGLDALTKLTNGNVCLNVHATQTISKVFMNSKKVQIMAYEGPHPAGNVSVHIQHSSPLNKGDVVWYLYPQDVITIGKLFKTGHYDVSTVIALTGSEVKHPVYFKSIRGAVVIGMLENNLKEGNIRIISGNVLTGTQIRPHGYVGFYNSMVTVIPEGSYYEFLGWALPGFSKFSFSRTFFSWLASKKKKYVLDTNYHGGVKAYVMTGQYEKVMPLDILPMQLIKACLVEDIDLMEGLGIYEVDEEDFALCEYLDTSKTEIQSIIRKGLDLMRKEMS